MQLLRRRVAERERISLVTTETIAAYEIASVVGFASGAASSRAGALDRLEEEASEWQADAVVAVRIDSSSRGGAFVGDDQCFAYGTAVMLRARSS